MSFWTDLSFYRPTRPPRVTGALLADFVRELSATGLFKRGGLDYLHLKFGRSVDQDMKGTTVYTPVPGCPSLSQVGSIKWDVEHNQIALNDVLTILSNHDRPIYRASVYLGTLRRDVHEALQTHRPDDGQLNVGFWDASVQIEPVELITLGGDDSFAVGWMSVGFGGNGYLYPWTPRDLTSRAESLEALRPVTEICRRHFPVDPNGTATVLERLTPARRQSRLRDIRRRMGELWPYEDLDRPWDWYWGVSETG